MVFFRAMKSEKGSNAGLLFWLHVAPKHFISQRLLKILVLKSRLLITNQFENFVIVLRNAKTFWSICKKTSSIVLKSPLRSWYKETILSSSSFLSLLEENKAIKGSLVSVLKSRRFFYEAGWLAPRSTSTLEAGFVFRVFLPLGLKSEFSILLDELPARATSLIYPELIGFKAPTARHRTTSISDKRPRDVNASGGDLANRGCGETQAICTVGRFFRDPTPGHC